MTARGLIIAAPHSGAGKTTITLAILAALKRRGVKINAAKTGPDYIDPAFHAAVTGRAAVNLDSWAMPAALLDMLAARVADSADIFVIEGVMGLFDGAAASAGRRGATADLAAHFDLPVVLVIDVARQAQSAAAVARGFASHDPAVKIAGVILNRTASERHRALVAESISALGLPIFGALPRDTAVI
jgi:cobyrinic acid a,c-diamide synthase